MIKGENKWENENGRIALVEGFMRLKMGGVETLGKNRGAALVKTFAIMYLDQGSARGKKNCWAPSLTRCTDLEVGWEGSWGTEGLKEILAQK